MKRIMALAAIGIVVATLSVGCSSSGSDNGGESDSKPIKVAYQKFGAISQIDTQMKAVKTQYEAANEGMTVELVPIEASDSDYSTKLALMNQSDSTAPDVMYEDTFMVKSDAAAGYLAPLDAYLDKWDDWSQFPDNAKVAGEGVDGKIYSISLGTDARALWYNQELLKKAGVTVPWEPKNWAEVVDAAKKIKETQEGVIPFNLYSGKAQGEGATMHGFEMLLYGTKDTLYDADGKKWIAGSQGFVDSLQFVKDIYVGELGPSLSQASDTNLYSNLSGTWLPKGELAIDLDGSWLSGNWLESGVAPWPEWNDVMALTPMPTQDGSEPGATSMSGGWTLAMGARSKDKDAAWNFMSLALNQANSLEYDIIASQIPVRDDVATDEKFVSSNPTNEFFSKLVEVTHFRPAVPNYPEVSGQIQVAMESVMTGQQTPEEAAKTYDEALPGIVGADNVSSVG